MSHDFKRVLLRAAETTRMLAAMRSLKPGPTILFYHGVEERLVDPRVQSLHLPMTFFVQQLDYLQRHFEVVPLPQVLDALAQGRKPDRRHVVLTFDDGYRNNLTQVASCLEARGMPFAVFVSTRHVSEGLRFPTYLLRTAILYTQRRSVTVLGVAYDTSTDEARSAAISSLARTLKKSAQPIADRLLSDLVALLPSEQWLELHERFASDQPMTWQDVRALRDRRVTIGSHCHDHFLLHAGQARGDLIAQIRTSRELVEREAGPCRYIAYPNGASDDVCREAIALVRAEGYLAGLTTIPGTVRAGCDSFWLPRVSAATGDMDRFRYAVSAGLQSSGLMR